MENKDKLKLIDKIIQSIKETKAERINKIILKLETMLPFTASDNEWFIPSIPILPPDLYNKYVIPNYIRCGAIPKKDLIVGREYEGDCRNAGRATWLGNQFEYTRYKWGSHYQETINHFEDDDGYDLFIPMRLIEEDE